jgi:hypothetical protein
MTNEAFQALKRGETVKLKNGNLYRVVWDRVTMGELGEPVFRLFDPKVGNTRGPVRSLKAENIVEKVGTP